MAKKKNAKRLKVVQISERECKRCGYTWLPRTPKAPEKCAGCNSPLWNTDRVYKTKRKHRAKLRKRS